MVGCNSDAISLESHPTSTGIGVRILINMKPPLILKNPQTIPTGISIPVGESLPLDVKRIVQELHLPVDIIIKGLEEVEQALVKGNSWLKEILDFRKVLYVRE